MMYYDVLTNVVVEGYGVSPRSLSAASQQGKDQVKKIVIDQARDWPYYFSRLYACNVSYIPCFNIK